MIHLALLILAACIVIPFFIALATAGIAGLLGLLNLLFGGWRWAVTVPAIFILGFIVDGNIQQNNEKHAQVVANNLVLQQQCEERVNAKAMELYKQAGGLFTQRGQQVASARTQAITNCEIQYPSY